MVVTAATSLIPKFRRHGSGRISKVNSSDMGPDGNGLAEPNERTPIIGNLVPSNSRTPLYKDERPYVRWPAYFLHVTWATLASNYVNVLLIFVPLGIIAGATGWNANAVFVLNFLAIIPLAALLSFATEEISVKLGQTLGGLMNATFGNAVELIVCLRLPPEQDIC
jgi:Ca2+:H+ antiporter